ncbi:uncharacterized protein PV09_07476 [Verruconis gallopava]|uniref:Uncharacterized protein n=1 Tax=Verruconis gallopava TaxID=253628 RepID=A0A0D2A3G4_9PEZI|nr:uncharacterized protein PV09_07476 [Verruconis gallopava]KIW00950.1 hypothetical protein PV09_07476 [Verruconis gallopava]
MVPARTLNTILLLVCFSAAAPRWWVHPGHGDFPKHSQAVSSAVASSSSPSSTSSIAVVQQNAQAVYTPPPGGVISNGILYLTTTIYLEPGQSPSSAVSPVSQNTPTAKPQSQQQSSPLASFATSIVQAPTTTSALNTPTAAAQTPHTASAISSPISSDSSSSTGGDGDVGLITADMVLAIAPQSSTCSSAPYPDECATANQAAPAFNSAFAKYGITTKGAQAAIMAWELFESGQLKYKMNHFPAPGTPGKGTRCMMSPEFVSEYATAVVGADKVSAAGSPAAVLDLVNGDDASSFGGGAWYMKTKCPDLIAQFSTAADASWASFMTSCVQTTDTSDRDALWTAAKQALGV